MTEDIDSRDHAETFAGRPAELFALIISGVLSTIVLVSLPIFAALLAQRTGATVEQAGWLASADLLGSAVVSATGLLWVGKYGWRKIVVRALMGAIILNIACLMIEGLYPMLLVRFLCGACYGVVLVTTFTGLCHSADPDKAFGWYVFLQLVFQICMLFSLPYVTALGGIGATFWYFAVFAMIGIVLARFIPDGLPKDRHIAPKGTKLPPSGIVGLVALGIYFLAPAALWGYFEPIGQTFDLDMSTIAEILGLTSFAGVLGAFTVVLIGVRFGRMPSMALGVLLSLAAVLMMDGGKGYQEFLIATCLFNFAWNFTFPFQMGVLALYDEEGSMAVPSLVVQLFGLAAGPFAASLLLIGGSFSLILMAAAASYVLSYFLFFASNRAAPNA